MREGGVGGERWGEGKEQKVSGEKEHQAIVTFWLQYHSSSSF